MPSQRPFFLSSFFSAFRQQAPALQTNQQPHNKHSQTSAAAGPSSASSTSASAAAAAAAAGYSSASTPSSTSRAIASSAAAAAGTRSPSAGVAIHSPRAGPGAGSSIPIPSASGGRRRGSDSSSEGFKDVLGAEKWYIGGRTAGGEEKFFKLGVVRRVRSNDGLSLDRLSL